jgi:hypothetical protein
VLVIDSITHLWEAARATYNGKLLPNGGIPIQAWQQIKKPYKRLMSIFLDGSFDAILSGREGVVMEQDEDGEMRVTARSSRPKAKLRTSCTSSGACARSAMKRAATSSRSSSKRTAPGS